MSNHQKVQFTILAQGVTTNTTSTPVQLHSTGRKTFYGKVSGTGAVAQTQAIYGTPQPTATDGVLVGTITLSGTTSDVDATSVVTANFPYYYIVTTDTSGTGATGVVYAFY